LPKWPVSFTKNAQNSFFAQFRQPAGRPIVLNSALPTLPERETMPIKNCAPRKIRLGRKFMHHTGTQIG